MPRDRKEKAEGEVDDEEIDFIGGVAVFYGDVGYGGIYRGDARRESTR
jgi:hypothetical protein